MRHVENALEQSISTWRDLFAIGHEAASQPTMNLQSGLLTVGLADTRRVFKLPRNDKELEAVQKIAETHLKANVCLRSRVKSLGARALKIAVWSLMCGLYPLQLLPFGSRVLSLLNRVERYLERSARFPSRGDREIQQAVSLIQEAVTTQAAQLKQVASQKASVQASIAAKRECVNAAAQKNYIDSLLDEPRLYLINCMRETLERQMKGHVASTKGAETLHAIYQFEKDVPRGMSFHGQVTQNGQTLLEVNPDLSKGEVAAALSAILRLTTDESDKEACRQWRKALQAAASQCGALIASSTLIEASTLKNSQDTTLPSLSNCAGSLYETALHVVLSEDGQHIERVNVETTTPLDVVLRNRETGDADILVPSALETKVCYSLTLDDRGELKVDDFKLEIVRHDGGSAPEIAPWYALCVIGEALERKWATLDSQTITLNNGPFKGAKFPLPVDKKEWAKWEAMVQGIPEFSKSCPPTPTEGGVSDSDCEAPLPVATSFIPFFLKGVDEQTQCRRVSLVFEAMKKQAAELKAECQKHVDALLREPPKYATLQQSEEGHRESFRANLGCIDITDSASPRLDIFSTDFKRHMNFKGKVLLTGVIVPPISKHATGDRVEAALRGINTLTASISSVPIREQWNLNLQAAVCQTNAKASYLPELTIRSCEALSQTKATHPLAFANNPEEEITTLDVTLEENGDIKHVDVCYRGFLSVEMRDINAEPLRTLVPKALEMTVRYKLFMSNNELCIENFSRSIVRHDGGEPITWSGQ